MTLGAKVLVVDDNAINRRLLATLLTYEGYRVREAADGAEGLSIARAELPQLVISDILMPTMDGYEFVRRLRADPGTAPVAVIFYTANYHEREAHSLARQCGVSRVLVKPCPTPQLLQAVADGLRGEFGAGAPPMPGEGFDAEHLRLLTNKLSDKADELRAANGRLAALTQLNLQMASERTPSRLLESVCAGARELLGARFAVLAVESNDRTVGPTVCVDGLAGLSPGSIVVPRDDQGVLGKVYSQGSPRRFVSDDETPLDLGLPDAFAPVYAALAVPVCSLTRVYGWVCLGDKIGATAFSEEDEKLLSILGSQLGRIYESGSLYLEIQEQATALMIEVEERGRAVSELLASEELFRQLAETIQDVFFVSSRDLSQASYISPGYERIWGRPSETVLRDNQSWLDTVHPEDRKRVASDYDAIPKAFPQHGRLEFRIVRPDGTTRWVLARIFPILDAAGTVVRAVGVASDITEQKLAEIRIIRLNRTYSVLSGINSLIVRAADRDELMRDACRLAVEHGGFRAAWCGLVHQETRTLRPSAFAGDAGDLPESISFTIDEDSARASLVVEALLTRLPQICNDLARDDAPAIHRQESRAPGYRSLVALPLIVGGVAIGCFVLLIDIPDYFDEEEIRLLADLAQDISFALDHIGKIERLRYLASYDPLTGLANRTAFETRVGDYIAMAAHTGSCFAVAIADPARFEALNNALGRQAGDELLRSVGKRFAAAAGGEDLVGRVGSDQFAVIIPCSPSGSEISRHLAQLWSAWLSRPFGVAGQTVDLSARAGVALFPDNGDTPAMLLAHAAAALSAAKDGDRTFGFYTPELSERFTERLSLEKSLRHALKNEEFELHYQPKVDLMHRRIHGVEALIRWRRPGQGLVMPGAFIPLLEENGLIVEVGAWALRQASLDRSRWRESGLAAPRIAVNVSAVQLRRDDFVNLVRRIVGPQGSDAGLDIEVTETLLMTDVAENFPKLEALRKLGIGIALDDFGTGYSSLRYLAQLPVETLKIDRSFVASMLEDPGAMTLVSTMISLARSLKLTIVAEGVETEEQAKILRLLGCDLMQGYLISKAVPFDELTKLLEHGLPTPLIARPA